VSAGLQLPRLNFPWFYWPLPDKGWVSTIVRPLLLTSISFQFILHRSTFPPRCSWDLRSSWMLCGVGWKVFTDVSGQHNGLISRTRQSKSNSPVTTGPLKIWPMVCPKTSVNNYQSRPRNFAQEWRNYLSPFILSSML